MRKPYPAQAAGLDPDTCLKPSGIKWIGAIPRNWTTVPLKYVATYYTSTVDKKAQDDEIEVRLCNYTDVYYRERINAEGEYMEATASPNEHSKFKLLVGDTVITKDSEDWRDIAVPALVEKTANDFVCGYHLGIIRPSPEVNPTFMFWAIKSTTTNQQMQVASSGVTRYGLPNPAVRRAVITIPPATDQRAIAGFLDRETARIDQLIAKHELLTERLGEYRKAVITRAVTKGLPPNAAYVAGLDPEPRLKPSGIEWVGNVPEHWEIKKLKYATSTNDEVITENEDPLRAVSYVDISSINPSTGITTTEDMVLEDAPTRARRLVQDGDTIVSTVRTYLRAVAPIHHPPPEMVVSTGFAVIRPRKIESGYCSWVLREHRFIEQIVANSNGVSYPAINATQIGELSITLPPTPEQRAIAQYLDQKTARIDALSQRAETAIQRLNEYRTALITAAVTGKIDLRESDVVEEPKE